MDSTSSAPYSQVQQIALIVGREQVQLVTKPGLPTWDSFSASTNLFIEKATIKPDDSILLFGCHLGTLAAVLSRRYPISQIYITDHLHSSIEMTRQTLAVNRVKSVSILEDVVIPEHLKNSFKTVYIQIPKGRQLARRWLMQAHQALVEGGSLYVAGANKGGIQSVIKDAGDLFGKASLLAYRRGNRIALCTKKSSQFGDTEWARLPGIAPDTWFEFDLQHLDQTYPIRSLPGVFSYDRLDAGTQMLLSAATIPHGSRVLDVGCGYGIIGMYATQHGASYVHLVDNDLLAIAACKATLALNGITNAAIYSGDLLEPVRSYPFDLILSNPPFHTGHAVDYRIAEALIGQSFQALTPGGQLTIVANRFIRYDRLIKSTFGNVSLLAESGKFHLLSGLKSQV